MVAAVDDGYLPLLLLCFPTRNGVYAAVMLCVLTFADYPALFIRTGDTGGVISGTLVLPFRGTVVLLRTALLVALVLRPRVTGYCGGVRCIRALMDGKMRLIRVINNV